ncbi:hypothetical protein D3C78_935640 [compost metagenome]
MKHPLVTCAILLSLSPITSEALDLTGSGSSTNYKITPSLDDSNLSRIEIEIPNTKKTVSAYFELGDGGIIPGYFPGEFALYTEYHTRSPLISSYTFRWNPELQDWIAYRASTWEEPYRDEKYTLNKEQIPDDLKLPQNFDTRRIKCCAKLSEFTESSSPNIEPETHDKELKNIEDDLKKISTALAKNKGKSIFYQNIGGEPTKKIAPPDLSHELSKIVSIKNLVELNNFAYLLQKNDDDISAAIILQSIHKKHPERVVATLNLADSYWKLNMKSSACPLYAKYIASMKASGKQDKIPKTAFYRATCN